MTVAEYRSRNPKCAYCVYRPKIYDVCPATKKVTKKYTAKFCPCFWAEIYELNKKTARGE